MHGAMKESLKATTRRMMPVLAQTVQRHLPDYRIEEFATDEKIKAWAFSCSADMPPSCSAAAGALLGNGGMALPFGRTAMPFVSDGTAVSRNGTAVLSNGSAVWVKWGCRLP